MDAVNAEPLHYQNGWIGTFTGRKFFPLIPHPMDICIQDIAHALSVQSRFTGHCPCPYSVAQHSVLVSHHCDPADALAGLLHDSAEAYITDLSRPVKEALRAQGITIFDDIEAGIMNAVCRRFGLPLTMPASVKRADDLLLATEARDFFSHQPLYAEWRHRPENGYAVLPLRIEPLDWRWARCAFLDRYCQLTGERVVIDEEPISTLWGEV